MLQSAKKQLIIEKQIMNNEPSFSAHLKVSAKLIYLTKLSAMFLCVELGKASVVLVS
jgi:hypothetical protein